MCQIFFRSWILRRSTTSGPPISMEGVSPFSSPVSLDACGVSFSAPAVPQPSDFDDGSMLIVGPIEKYRMYFINNFFPDFVGPLLLSV